MADESDAEFSIGGKSRFMSFTAARSDCGVAHQTSELGGAPAERPIAKCLLNHPAYRPGAGSKQPAAFMLFLIAARAE